MTAKRKVILVIAAVFAVALIAAAIFLAVPRKAAVAYRQAIERAELYYGQGEYRLAALEYRSAIGIDDKAVDAYEGLSYTYIQMGDLQSAWQVASEGYGRTQDTLLNTLIGHIESGRYGKFVRKVGSDVEEVLNLDDILLRRISSTAYSSYRRKAQPVSQQVQRDGSVEVIFAEIPGVMVFRNSAQQVSAVQNGNVTDSAIPEEVHLDDLKSMFGKLPLTKAELASVGVADIVLRNDPSQGQVEQFTLGGCTFTVECDADGTIPVGAYNSIVPSNAIQLAGSGSGDKMTILGSLKDAQTGDPVDGISLRFFPEGESTYGDPVAEYVTDTNGEYEVDVPPGIYTVEISGDGYITEYREMTVSEYDVETQEDFIITKELGEGEARIVLEWGATPTDLDSHLKGRTDSGIEIHVFFSNKSCSDANGVVADLDLDDTTSYGPETTTIYNLNGKYDFWVNNYKPSTGTIEGSGAKISLYLPGQPVQTFTVSDGRIEGNDWYIFTIDHGRLVTDASPQTPDFPEDPEEAEESAPEADAVDSQSGESLTMASAGLPFGLYSGAKPQGDGAIPTTLQLNEDMTYRLHCTFPIFDRGEPEDSDYEYTYTGTYKVDRRNIDGNPVLAFTNSVENFELVANGTELRGEYFYVSYGAAD